MNYCSRLDLSEPLAGTAPDQARIVLIEQPGPWGKDALSENRGNGSLHASLDSLTSVGSVKVYLIRHDHRRAISTRNVWWLLRHDHAVTAHHGELGINDAITAHPPRGAQPVTAATTFLCTNGKRDRCCAEFTRALIRPYARSSEVWECSHLGGHRFAPTAIRTDGVLFGRLEAATLADVVHGDTPAGNIRGGFGWPPWQQAAMIAVYRENGGAFAELSASGSPECVTVSAGDRHWEVPVSAHETRRVASCGQPPKAVTDWVPGAVRPA